MMPKVGHRKPLEAKRCSDSGVSSASPTSYKSTVTNEYLKRKYQPYVRLEKVTPQYLRNLREGPSRRMNLHHCLERKNLNLYSLDDSNLRFEGLHHSSEDEDSKAHVWASLRVDTSEPLTVKREPLSSPEHWRRTEEQPSPNDLSVDKSPAIKEYSDALKRLNADDEAARRLVIDIPIREICKDDSVRGGKVKGPKSLGCRVDDSSPKVTSKMYYDSDSRHKNSSEISEEFVKSSKYVPKRRSQRRIESDSSDGFMPANIIETRSSKTYRQTDTRKLRNTAKKSYQAPNSSDESDNAESHSSTHKLYYPENISGSDDEIVYRSSESINESFEKCNRYISESEINKNLNNSESDENINNAIKVRSKKTNSKSRKNLVIQSDSESDESDQIKVHYCKLKNTSKPVKNVSESDENIKNVTKKGKQETKSTEVWENTSNSSENNSKPRSKSKSRNFTNENAQENDKKETSRKSRTFTDKIQNNVDDSQNVSNNSMKAVQKRSKTPVKTQNFLDYKSKMTQNVTENNSKTQKGSRRKSQNLADTMLETVQNDTKMHENSQNHFDHNFESTENALEIEEKKDSRTLKQSRSKSKSPKKSQLFINAESLEDSENLSEVLDNSNKTLTMPKTHQSLRNNVDDNFESTHIVSDTEKNIANDSITQKGPRSKSKSRGKLSRSFDDKVMPEHDQETVKKGSKIEVFDNSTKKQKTSQKTRENKHFVGDEFESAEFRESKSNTTESYSNSLKRSQSKSKTCKKSDEIIRETIQNDSQNPFVVLDNSMKKQNLQYMTKDIEKELNSSENNSKIRKQSRSKSKTRRKSQNANDETSNIKNDAKSHENIDVLQNLSVVLNKSFKKQNKQDVPEVKVDNTKNTRNESQSRKSMNFTDEITQEKIVRVSKMHVNTDYSENLSEILDNPTKTIQKISKIDKSLQNEKTSENHLKIRKESRSKSNMRRKSRDFADKIQTTKLLHESEEIVDTTKTQKTSKTHENIKNYIDDNQNPQEINECVTKNLPETFESTSKIKRIPRKNQTSYENSPHIYENNHNDSKSTQKSLEIHESNTNTYENISDTSKSTRSIKKPLENTLKSCENSLKKTHHEKTSSQIFSNLEKNGQRLPETNKYASKTHETIKNLSESFLKIGELSPKTSPSLSKTSPSLNFTVEVHQSAQIVSNFKRNESSLRNMPKERRTSFEGEITEENLQRKSLVLLSSPIDTSPRSTPENKNDSSMKPEETTPTNVPVSLERFKKNRSESLEKLKKGSFDTFKKVSVEKRPISVKKVDKSLENQKHAILNNLVETAESPVKAKRANLNNLVEKLQHNLIHKSPEYKRSLCNNSFTLLREDKFQFPQESLVKSIETDSKTTPECMTSETSRLETSHNLIKKPEDNFESSNSVSELLQTYSEISEEKQPETYEMSNASELLESFEMCEKKLKPLETDESLNVCELPKSFEMSFVGTQPSISFQISNMNMESSKMSPTESSKRKSWSAEIESPKLLNATLEFPKSSKLSTSLTSSTSEKTQLSMENSETTSSQNSINETSETMSSGYESKVTEILENHSSESINGISYEENDAVDEEETYVTEGSSKVSMFSETGDLKRKNILNNEHEIDFSDCKESSSEDVSKQTTEENSVESPKQQLTERNKKQSEDEQEESILTETEDIATNTSTLEKKFLEPLFKNEKNSMSQLENVEVSRTNVEISHNCKEDEGDEVNNFKEIKKLNAFEHENCITESTNNQKPKQKKRKNRKHIFTVQKKRKPKNIDSNTTKSRKQKEAIECETFLSDSDVQRVSSRMSTRSRCSSGSENLSSEKGKKSLIEDELETGDEAVLPTEVSNEVLLTPIKTKARKTKEDELIPRRRISTRSSVSVGSEESSVKNPISVVKSSRKSTSSVDNEEAAVTNSTLDIKTQRKSTSIDRDDRKSSSAVEDEVQVKVSEEQITDIKKRKRGRPKKIIQQTPSAIVEVTAVNEEFKLLDDEKNKGLLHEMTENIIEPSVVNEVESETISQEEIISAIENVEMAVGKESDVIEMEVDKPETIAYNKCNSAKKIGRKNKLKSDGGNKTLEEKPIQVFEDIDMTEANIESIETDKLDNSIEMSQAPILELAKNSALFNNVEELDAHTLDEQDSKKISVKKQEKFDAQPSSLFPTEQTSPEKPTLSTQNNKMLPHNFIITRNVKMAETDKEITGNVKLTALTERTSEEPKKLEKPKILSMSAAHVQKCNKLPYNFKITRNVKVVQDESNEMIDNSSTSSAKSVVNDEVTSSTAVKDDDLTSGSFKSTCNAEGSTDNKLTDHNKERNASNVLTDFNNSEGNSEETREAISELSSKDDNILPIKTNDEEPITNDNILTAESAEVICREIPLKQFNCTFNNTQIKEMVSSTRPVTSDSIQKISSSLQVEDDDVFDYDDYDIDSNNINPEADSTEPDLTTIIEPSKKIAKQPSVKKLRPTELLKKHFKTKLLRRKLLAKKMRLEKAKLIQKKSVKPEGKKESVGCFEHLNASPGNSKDSNVQRKIVNTEGEKTSEGNVGHLKELFCLETSPRKITLDKRKDLPIVPFKITFKNDFFIRDGGNTGEPINSKPSVNKMQAKKSNAFDIDPIEEARLLASDSSGNEGDETSSGGEDSYDVKSKKKRRRRSGDESDVNLPGYDLRCKLIHKVDEDSEIARKLEEFRKRSDEKNLGDGELIEKERAHIINQMAKEYEETKAIMLQMEQGSNKKVYISYDIPSMKEGVRKILKSNKSEEERRQARIIRFGLTDDALIKQRSLEIKQINEELKIKNERLQKLDENRINNLCYNYFESNNIHFEPPTKVLSNEISNICKEYFTYKECLKQSDEVTQPGNDQFKPSNNRFEPSNEPFKASNDHFEPNNSCFGPNNTLFGQSNDRFEPVNTCIEQSNSPFELSTALFNPSNNRLEASKPRFVPSNARIMLCDDNSESSKISSDATNNCNEQLITSNINFVPFNRQCNENSRHSNETLHSNEAIKNNRSLINRGEISRSNDQYLRRSNENLTIQNKETTRRWSESSEIGYNNSDIINLSNNNFRRSNENLSRSNNNLLQADYKRRLESFKLSNENLRPNSANLINRYTSIKNENFVSSKSNDENFLTNNRLHGNEEFRTTRSEDYDPRSERSDEFLFRSNDFDKRRSDDFNLRRNADFNQSLYDDSNRRKSDGFDQRGYNDFNQRRNDDCDHGRRNFPSDKFNQGNGDKNRSDPLNAPVTNSIQTNFNFLDKDPEKLDSMLSVRAERFGRSVIDKCNEMNRSDKMRTQSERSSSLSINSNESEEIYENRAKSVNEIILAENERIELRKRSRSETGSDNGCDNVLRKRSGSIKSIGSENQMIGSRNEGITLGNQIVSDSISIESRNETITNGNQIIGRNEPIETKNEVIRNKNEALNFRVEVKNVTIKSPGKTNASSGYGKETMKRLIRARYIDETEPVNLNKISAPQNETTMNKPSDFHTTRMSENPVNQLQNQTNRRLKKTVIETDELPGEIRDSYSEPMMMGPVKRTFENENQTNKRLRRATMSQGVQTNELMECEYETNARKETNERIRHENQTNKRLSRESLHENEAHRDLINDHRNVAMDYTNEQSSRRCSLTGSNDDCSSNRSFNKDSEERCSLSKDNVRRSLSKESINRSTSNSVSESDMSCTLTPKKNIAEIPSFKITVRRSNENEDRQVEKMSIDGTEDAEPESPMETSDDETSEKKPHENYRLISTNSSKQPPELPFNIDVTVPPPNYIPPVQRIRPVNMYKNSPWQNPPPQFHQPLPVVMWPPALPINPLGWSKPSTSSPTSSRTAVPSQSKKLSSTWTKWSPGKSNSFSTRRYLKKCGEAEDQRMMPPPENVSPIKLKKENSTVVMPVRMEQTSNRCLSPTKTEKDDDGISIYVSDELRGDIEEPFSDLNSYIMETAAPATPPKPPKPLFNNVYRNNQQHQLPFPQVPDSVGKWVNTSTMALQILMRVCRLFKQCARYQCRYVHMLKPEFRLRLNEAEVEEVKEIFKYLKQCRSSLVDVVMPMVVRYMSDRGHCSTLVEMVGGVLRNLACDKADMVELILSGLTGGKIGLEFGKAVDEVMAFNGLHNAQLNDILLGIVVRKAGFLNDHWNIITTILKYHKYVSISFIEDIMKCCIRLPKKQIDNPKQFEKICNGLLFLDSIDVGHINMNVMKIFLNKLKQNKLYNLHYQLKDVYIRKGKINNFQDYTDDEDSDGEVTFSNYTTDDPDSEAENCTCNIPMRDNLCWHELKIMRLAFVENNAFTLSGLVRKCVASNITIPLLTHFVSDIQSFNPESLCNIFISLYNATDFTSNNNLKNAIFELGFNTLPVFDKVKEYRLACNIIMLFYEDLDIFLNSRSFYNDPPYMNNLRNHSEKLVFLFKILSRGGKPREASKCIMMDTFDLDEGGNAVLYRYKKNIICQFLTGTLKTNLAICRDTLHFLLGQKSRMSMDPELNNAYNKYLHHLVDDSVNDVANLIKEYKTFMLKNFRIIDQFLLRASLVMMYEKLPILDLAPLYDFCCRFNYYCQQDMTNGIQFKLDVSIEEIRIIYHMYLVKMLNKKMSARPIPIRIVELDEAQSKPGNSSVGKRVVFGSYRKPDICDRQALMYRLPCALIGFKPTVNLTDVIGRTPVIPQESVKTCLEEVRRTMML